MPRFWSQVLNETWLSPDYRTSRHASEGAAAADLAARGPDAAVVHVLRHGRCRCGQVAEDDDRVNRGGARRRAAIDEEAVDATSMYPGAAMHPACGRGR